MAARRETPLRFAVIGCGSIGQRHVRNLVALDAGEVVAFDVREDRRRDVASRFGIEVPDRLDEVWRRGPDAVVVAVPPHAHVPLALQAAARGCHLFIEKPLSDRWDGTEELLDAVRARGLVTLVGCNMRFHPGLVTVKKLLEDGAIGRVVAGRAEVGQYLPDWRPAEDYRQAYSARRDQGGGVILDAIHELDYLRWMLGDVGEIACFSGRLGRLEIDTEDTAAMLLRFTSGAIGEVHLDYLQRAYSRTCHLIGEEGTIRWDYSAGEVRCYTASERRWRSWANPAGWEPNQMYIDEIRHFVECLTRDAHPAADVFEAAQVLKIALAAKTSARSGGVVRLEGSQG